MRAHRRLAGIGALGAVLTCVALGGADGTAAGVATSAAITGEWPAPKSLPSAAPLLFAPDGSAATIDGNKLVPLVAGTPQPPRQLATGMLGAFVAGYGKGDFIAVSAEAVGSPALKLYDATLGGRVLDTGTIPDVRAAGTDGRPGLLALAADQDGDVAALIESCGCDRVAVLLAVRRRGAKRFGRPTVLAWIPGNGGLNTGAVAVSNSGAVLAAWVAGGLQVNEGKVVERLLLPDGSLTVQTPLGDAFGDALITAALDARGRPTVAWESEVLGEGCFPHSPVTTSAATGDVHGHFGRVQTLESFDSSTLRGYCLEREQGVQQSQFLVGLVEAPEPLIAWTGSQRGRMAVRAARLENGRFGPTQTLSRPDGDDQILAGLGVGPGDRAVAAWTSAPRSHDGLDVSPAQLLAAIGPAGSRFFGAPETIGRPLAGAPPEGPTYVAVDPLTRRAVVDWDGLFAARR